MIIYMVFQLLTFYILSYFLCISTLLVAIVGEVYHKDIHYLSTSCLHTGVQHAAVVLVWSLVVGQRPGSVVDDGQTAQQTHTWWYMWRKIKHNNTYTVCCTTRIALGQRPWNSLLYSILSVIFLQRAKYAPYLSHMNYECICWFQDQRSYTNSLAISLGHFRKRTPPIPPPHRGAMGSLLLVPSLTNVLLLSLICCMHYLFLILDHAGYIESLMYKRPTPICTADLWFFLFSETSSYIGV